MSELLFNVTQESDGGYVAIAVGESIATQGDTWDELCYMVLDATKLYCLDKEARQCAPPHCEHVLSVTWL